MMDLKSLVRGLVFSFLWFGSICSGFIFLYCPLLPLLFLNQKLFRQLTDIIFAAWELYPSALCQCIFGVKVVVVGDEILPHDQALIIMNHRTRVDWNFLWLLMYHACKPLAHRIKMVLKTSVKQIPGAGWVMQMNCFLYIHRRWERDKALLERGLDYFRDLGHSCQILLFPEGTDLTAESRLRSHKFATIHQLERYYQVLHPKTTGFVFLVQRMRQIFTGSSLPTGEEELKDWLAARWKHKEETLTKFLYFGSFDSSNVSPDTSTTTMSNGSLPTVTQIQEDQYQLE